MPRVRVLWPWHLSTTVGQGVQELCWVQPCEQDGPVTTSFQRVEGSLVVI